MVLINTQLVSLLATGCLRQDVGREVAQVQTFADKLGWADKAPSWKAIAQAAAQGKLRYAMTNPTASNQLGSFVWYDQMSNDVAGAGAFYTKVVGWTLAANTMAQASQSVTLTGLQRNTTYYYVIRSIDRSGNITMTLPNNFTTTN